MHLKKHKHWYEKYNYKSKMTKNYNYKYNMKN